MQMPRSEYLKMKMEHVGEGGKTCGELTNERVLELLQLKFRIQLEQVKDV